MMVRKMLWCLVLASCAFPERPPHLPPGAVAPAPGVQADPAPPPVPRPSVESPGGAALTVTLAWTDPVDLDLYVTDPSGETVYFGNPHGASGGVLERDARCADGAAGEHEERTVWTDAPSGRYRVGVDFMEPCDGRRKEAEYRVVVSIGDRREETRGRIRLGQRQTRVVEFTVP
jgi:hypothetical protein